MIKRLFIVMMLLLPLATALPAQDKNDPKYLAGAVPLKNGSVIFDKTYKVSGKSKSELFRDLKAYAETLVKGENSLQQSRIVEDDSVQGLLALRMEETLYFRKTAWVTHSTRLFYELIFTVGDGQFTVEMRRIHYLYDEGSRGDEPYSFTAEEWITDEEALSKDGKKLLRVPGRFRRFTIDRKDEIFRGAARATGAIQKRKVIQEIEVEE